MTLLASDQTQGRERSCHNEPSPFAPTTSVCVCGIYPLPLNTVDAITRRPGFSCQNYHLKYLEDPSSITSILLQNQDQRKQAEVSREHDYNFTRWCTPLTLEGLPNFGGLPICCGQFGLIFANSITNTVK